jgi:serine/threonine-protein kinase
MDIQEAIGFVDELIYQKTGKYLSDLERDVFIGSWNGKTYEEIYPTNPEYVEKYVGYKLWQKLSAVCAEKVTKKQFRGALERTWQRHQDFAACLQNNPKPEQTLPPDAP